MAVRKFAQNLLELGSERLKRAKEQGFDTDQTWYHGSTHNIKEMGGDTINPESHFGAGYYLTSSADDASKNYAGVGPDLTQRIQLRAEQIAGAEDLPFEDPGVLARAEAELKGDSDGVIYPAYTRTKKTFDISSDGDTFLEYKQPDLDPEDYLDEADGDMDLAEELARDDSYNFEPEGDLVDFIESLRYDERIEHGKDELIGAILDESYDGGISGKRLDEIMRNTDFFANNFDTGDLGNNEVYRTALEEAGFDSVVHDGDIFKGMEIEPGTKHKIIFAPENIRSINAEFDPEKTDSKKLLASVAPLLIGGGLLANQDAQAGVLSSGAKNLLDAAPERLKQAKKQGFDTSKPLYHGTRYDGGFDEFTPGRSGLSYFAEDIDYAKGYGPNVGEFYLKPGKQFDPVSNASHRKKMIDLFNSKGGWQQRAEGEGYGSAKEFWMDGGIDDRDSYLYDPRYDDDWEILDEPETDILFDLQNEGFDSYRFYERNDEKIIAQAVADPTRVRSVDAQFDPKKTDSAQLLAGAAPVGLLSQPTAKDKAVAVGETLLDAGQAMIAPMAAAPHALIPALTSNMPTAQIEQNYQNLLQQQNYEPSTQLGQQYSQQAQQFMGDAFNAAAQSAPGRAIGQFVEPINLLMQQAPDRARLIGRSLLDASPF
tara:strand:- start:735 stop:2696 length:1962 start_codon:yes stop_codon:yes gene_type:complete